MTLKEFEMAEASREILIPHTEITRRVKDVARGISRDYAGGDLLIVGILKGAFIFMADLVRELTIPCQTDFIRAASYGEGAESCGRVVITKDVEMAVEGRDVLIVEDIVDTGLTLSHIVDSIGARKPKSVKVCAFLDKRKRRKVPFEADYVCFTIDDGFVVGYGLDFNEQYRSLPDVYVVQA